MEYFICLCEEGSATKASKRLCIVQPALSVQITKLEAELGQILFERTPKGMVTTEAGKQAYQVFQPLFADLYKARQNIINSGGEITGPISAALISSASSMALSEVLTHFTKNHPDVDIYTTTGFTPDMVHNVRKGVLDFAVINKTTETESLESIPVLTEELYLVTNPDSDFTFKSPVRFEDIVDKQVVLPSKRHGLRTIIDERFAAKNLVLKPRLQIDDLCAIEEFVRHNDWVGILPAITINESIRQGVLKAYSFETPGIQRFVACVYPPHRPLCQAAQLFVEILTKHMLDAAELIQFYKS